MIIGIDASRANTLQRTGVESYAFEIIEGLKKTLPGDVTVRLYSREPLQGPIAKLPENWESKVLAWSPKRLWTQLRLSLEMVLHKPDILFVPAHVAPLIHPRKTVMMVHDVAAMRFPEGYNLFEQWYSLFSARQAVKKFWKVLVPSQFTKEELLDLQSGDEKKIHVVHHGYTKIDETAADVQKKHEVTKPYVFFVGRLEEKKNVRRIIQTFNKLKEKHDLQLVLAGNPGYGYEKVIQAMNDSEHKEDILQLGWTSPEDVRALTAGAELFLFPTMYEGFGLPVLESFDARTPVVTAAGHATEEVAGDAAICVDAEDVDAIVKACNDILSDKNLAGSLVEKGKERLKDFSWEKAAKETAQLLIDKTSA